MGVTNTTAANLFMGVAATPDGRIYASGGNANRVFRFRLAGGSIAVNQDATEAATVPTHTALDGFIGRGPSPDATLPASDGIRVNGYPGNNLLSGGRLYVAGTLSEPTGTTPEDICPSGQAVCARVTIVDPGSDTVISRVPVGMDAYAMALDQTRGYLYVTNWADEAGRGGPGGGTVSVVDVRDVRHPREIAVAHVGHHPSAIQLSADRSTLFVANTNDDTISIIDVRNPSNPMVFAPESVKPVDGAPVGAHPDAFALSPDGRTLYVALAGLNAIEVRDGRSGARVAGHPMYIPTGWYPSALAVTGTAQHYKLWVANAKGIGPGPGANGSVFFNGGPTANGTVSAISLPAPATTANLWSNQVAGNDKFSRFSIDPCRPDAGIARSQVLCPPAGQSSPIKHVLYIVVENKTFDQYFGDLDQTKWDADPSTAIYGQNVTPNQHALATNGLGNLNDRFYSDAEVSVTGHSWTSGAIATDHNEKTWPADYDQGVRSSHGGGDPLRPSVGDKPAKAIADADNELQDPEGGYIFEAFKRAGAVPPANAGPAKLSMAIYGEHTAEESGNMDAYKAPNWKDGDIQYFDSCRATEFVTGTSPQGPSPDGNPYLADCEGRTLPPQFNLAHWNDVMKKTGRDVMPNTLGTNLGSPTPASMVADNDYAIGMIVDALSHSPYWSSTAVMITQDDTQAASDHVSALRDELQVISPWAKPGPSHQWGSMPSLLRTVEVLFKIPPVSLNDRLAMPQHQAFLPRLSDGPHLQPYTVTKPVVPFALNGPGAPMQSQSMSMDFTKVDRIDEQLLNEILYADAAAEHLTLGSP